MEKEGVVFDSDRKICIDCFVDVSSVAVSVAAVVSLTTAQGKKKRKADYNTTSTKKKTKSKYFTDTTSQSTTTISEDVLKQEILTLLQKRQAGKTC